MHTRAIVMCLACLGLLTASTAAGQERSIALSVYVAKQPNAPVQVIQLAPHSATGKGPRIIVKNFSNHQVVSYILEARVTSGCTVTDHPQPISLGRRRQQKKIAPKQRADWDEDILDPPGLVVTAKELKAAYLDVQVGVDEVEFADGAIWKYQFSDIGGQFTPSFVQADEKRCRAWKTPPSVLEDVSTFSYVKTESDEFKLSLVPQNGTLGYFATCTVTQTLTLCPE